MRGSIRRQAIREFGIRGQHTCSPFSSAHFPAQFLPSALPANPHSGYVENPVFIVPSGHFRVHPKVLTMATKARVSAQSKPALSEVEGCGRQHHLDCP